MILLIRCFAASSKILNINKVKYDLPGVGVQEIQIETNHSHVRHHVSVLTLGIVFETIAVTFHAHVFQRIQNKLSIFI